MQTLVICEKPSVARDIAQFLGCSERHEGYLSGNNYAITWAFGHLLELKEPEEYNKYWKSWKIEDLPIVPEKFELRPRKDKGIREQLNLIKKLASESDDLICATDAGREGELIFRYIQQYLKLQKKPFKRLWVSSLTHEALQEGFKNLKDGSVFDPLYRAAKCRSEADWLVGINATRYFTTLYGSQDLYSIGRVQTPVLAMIVERDLEIQNFVESEFWELHTLFQGVRFRSLRGKIESLQEAEAVLKHVEGKNLEIVEITQKEESVAPPFLYDLTELQKDMNKKHSLSADETLKAAQSLYEKKHITYPRTDSKFLTLDVARQLPELLEKLRPYRKEEIGRLDLKTLNLGPRIVNDLKVTDHHAIIPTLVVPKARMSEPETLVYRAILTRLLAALYPPAKKQVLSLKARVADEEFKASHSELVDLGWEILYPKANKKQKEEDNSEENASGASIDKFHSLRQGQSGPHDPHVKTQKTKAPQPFNEAGILQMMETAGRRVSDDEMKLAIRDKGLGTPATRASIIETLLARKYISRTKKGIISTISGRKLIDLVQEPRLKSPELTAEWEFQLKQIENAAFDDSVFMQDVNRYVKDIVSYGDSQLGLGPCPLCRASVIEGKKGYGCSAWKTGCQFVLWKELKGSSISPKVATQLLRLGKTLEPFVCLDQQGQQQYLNLSLSAVGALEFALTEASPEQIQQNLKSQKSAKNIGACPLCQAPVLESAKAFGCSRWKQGCQFVIWKTIAKRKISTEEAQSLLKDRVTPILDGFQSKEGKEFKARLELVGHELKFAFVADANNV